MCWIGYGVFGLIGLAATEQSLSLLELLLFGLFPLLTIQFGLYFILWLATVKLSAGRRLSRILCGISGGFSLLLFPAGILFFCLFPAYPGLLFLLPAAGLGVGTTLHFWKKYFLTNTRKGL